MFKNVGRQFFEWGKLICKCKTGIFLSFEFDSQKWAWGKLTEKIALNQFVFFISKSIYQLITCCISVCQKRKSPSQ